MSTVPPVQIPPALKLVLHKVTEKQLKLIAPEMGEFTTKANELEGLRDRLRRMLNLCYEPFGDDPQIQYDSASGEFWKLAPPPPPPPPPAEEAVEELRAAVEQANPLAAAAPGPEGEPAAS